ncbi:MAG: hypothetical protein GY757_37595, partial [bacterium]|nr:hypothetical protein [bacterium]
LDFLNKNATVEDNHEVLKLIAEFPDIYITFGFIMLHPASTLQDMKDNARFLLETGIGQVIRHYFWQLEIYPGTTLETLLIEENMLTDDYDIREGMYKYTFKDPEVKRFAGQFLSLLEVQSVWDFEIFDIIIHTFITRLRRKYMGQPVFREIMTFSDVVQKTRKEMAEFNYTFFMKLMEDKEFDMEKEKQRLDRFILDKMDFIKKQQLEFGLDFRRKGYPLVNR